MEKKIYIIVSNNVHVLNDGSLKVTTSNGYVGYCSYNEISDYPIDDLDRFFSNYPSYKFRVIGINEQDNTLILSYKQCHPRLIKEKKRIISTANHYKTLRKTVLLDIKNYEDEK